MGQRGWFALAHSHIIKSQVRDGAPAPPAKSSGRRWGAIAIVALVAIPSLLRVCVALLLRLRGLRAMMWWVRLVAQRPNTWRASHDYRKEGGQRPWTI